MATPADPGAIPPNEVRDIEEKCCAWTLFVVLMVGFLMVPNIVYVIYKLNERSHPAVSISFKAEDIDLPYFYICPTPTAAGFDDIIIYGFTATCQFISKDSPPSDYNATLPLDWDVNRTPDRTFGIIYSNCPVQTTRLPNLGLCFGYNITGYTAKNYIEDTIILSVAFAYRSPPPAYPLFLRSFFLVSSFSAQPLPNQTTSVGARFSQELPLSQQSQLTLALTDTIDISGKKDRTGVGESIYFLPYSDPTFFYPSGLAEIAFVKMRFESRGVYVVEAKNPWNWFDFVSLQYSLYGYAIGAFTLAYGFTNERKITKAWRRLRDFFARRCILPLQGVGRSVNPVLSDGGIDRVELTTRDPES
eukprot:TRINITY_DN2459_c0_g1_i1.p1 TRINITY_DN2459_c0_g1~~TRINITY_DN2459_c0_g1_i1.p1  ORF type:complete len:360 (+),score=38.92 TRINITY_DN2459_c0_g1_i1:46-1125(+)